MAFADTLNAIVNGGGKLEYNGQATDALDLIAKFSNDNIDAGDMGLMDSELQAILEDMNLRHLPLQARPFPDGPGMAPTLDFRVPGNAGQSWSIGSKWDQDLPTNQ